MRYTTGFARRIDRDAVLVALVAVLLSGCVTTPSKYRDRTGDFVMNIGFATDHRPTTPAAPGSSAVENASATGVG